MASIEQRVGSLFPRKRGKGPSLIAMAAAIFAERREQWLTQADIIKLMCNEFGDSTIRKAFRDLSRPIDALNGQPFINLKSVKQEGLGGPQLSGKISEAAAERIFATVTPVYQEPPPIVIREKRLVLRPLKTNYGYLSPKDILDARKKKSDEVYTSRLLYAFGADKLVIDKATLEKMIRTMAKNEGMEFNTSTGQFTKDGQEVSPGGNLANVYSKWRSGPYKEPSCVLTGHRRGPIPLKQHALTDIAMRKLATDENRAAYSTGISIIDSRQDLERIRAIEGRAKKKDSEAFEELIRVLSTDDSRYARQEAARSLGCLGDPRVIEPLIKAMLEDEYIAVRSIAAEGLSKFGYCSEFTQALSDSDPHIRRVIVEILGKIGDPRAIGPLIEALNDADTGVQCSAANSLGKLRDKRAVDVLISKLESEDESVRLAVTDALRSIGGSRETEVLMEVRDSPST